MRHAIIVFQKNPEPGKVKTRLAKTIGNEKAAKVYQFLINHTHQQIAPLEIPVFIFHQGPIDKESYSDNNYNFHPQEGNSLGEKMDNAFQTVLKNGYEKVLIIGSDCYELKTRHLEKAFLSLDHNNLVLGPARDGGYYLIGLKDPAPQLFHNIAWSTPSVLEVTLKKAENTGLKASLLETLSDVDRYEDLGDLKEMLDQF